MAPVEAECVGSPTAGGGAAEGIRERIHNRETSRLSSQRDRELSAGGIA